MAASQQRLDLAAVIMVSVIAGEAGGLAGYAIGRRWGRRLLERPGRHLARREKVMERGERLYARLGWLAVFVTPAIVSGTAKMPPCRFAMWNLLDALGWTVSVAASAYGVGRLATGHNTWHDIAILVIGLAAGAPRHRHGRAAVTACARPSVLLPSQTGRATIPRDQVARGAGRQDVTYSNEPERTRGFQRGPDRGPGRRETAARRVPSVR